MCGRFSLSRPEQLSDFFEIDERPVIRPRYNVAPSQPVWVVHLDPSLRRCLREMRWGLIPFWSKDARIGNRLINARSESVQERPSFRESFQRRRCLVPADGFFEWRRQHHGKQPFFVCLRERRLFAFAGLWDRWRDPRGETILSCTILTTAPNRLLAPLHDRMPVVLAPEEFDLWLDPDTPPPRLTKLLDPYPPEEMLAYPVSPLVNDPQNDLPECIQPQAGQKDLLF